MGEKQILNHIKQLLKEIANSPRWSDMDNPTRDPIDHLGERVNSSESMREFRSNEDYILLLDISSHYEECFNDDWLPHEIFGLKPNKAKLFLNEILKEYDAIQRNLHRV